jgi:hypothetical protein
MALVRRARTTTPDAMVGWPFDRSLFDWPFRAPFGAVQQSLQDDMKVEEYIDVQVIDGNLCIRAERRSEEKVEGRNYRRSEVRYGSFSRVLPLPASAEESDISATYKDGVLEVRAPLASEPSTPSKIPINRS